MRILITGANRGLGLAFAQRFAAADDSNELVATTRSMADAETLEELRGYCPDRVAIATCDLADPASVEGVAAELPWPTVDLLINNAGTYGASSTSIEEIDFAKMEEAFRINTVGTLRVTRAVWPRLCAAPAAKIVNVSSLMGSIADSSGGSYEYRASKAALNMVTRCLGFEAAAQGMTAFAIHPGWVRTRMGGAAAPLSVDDSADAMCATIDRLGPEANGGLVDRDGEPLPW